MSTQEGIRLQLQQKEIRRSSRRQTPLSSFAEQFKQGLATSAGVVSNVAATAGYAIPGGAIVSAALNSAGAVKSTGDDTGNTGVYAQSGTPGLGIPGAGGGVGESFGGGGPMDAVAGRAAAGDPNAQMMMATRQMQELNQQFNLQYLQLQEKMQHESRAYTVMSNVMKQKHDTSRNTLSNLK
jgi:hypothetical protein